MNPFSGFMQAVTGLVPGFGDNNVNIGKGIQGLPVNDDTILSANENTGSFLAWVQDYMENAAGADADGDSGFNFQPSDLDLDRPVLDQLQALIADAKEPFSEDQPVAHSLNGHTLDNGQVPLPQGIINAIIAHHARSHVAGIPTHEVLPDIPEMMVPKENTPAAGQAQAAGKGPQFQASASGVPAPFGQVDERQIKENIPAVGQTNQAAGKHPQVQAATSGIPTQAGQAEDYQNRESSPELLMKENRPEERLEKEDARALSKPAVSAGDDRQMRTNRLIQERLPSGPGVAGKASDPATPRLQPVADQTKGSESMVTDLAGQGSTHPEDDTANFRGKDPHHPAQRVERADVKEEEWQKGQSSENVKSTAAEQTKPHPSFQDTAKGMAGDPTTNMAVKPATGQAAALTQTEDAAAKTFQTTVMDQIVDKAAIRSIHGRSEIQIQLKPEFLGNVQMNIAADKEQLVVRIMTDRPVVKEIIETHLHHLKTELQHQGLTIDKFEVMVNPDANQQHSREQFAQMFKHHSSQNGRQQPHEQDPETLNRDGGNHSDDDRPNREGVNYFA
jgi:flagellar hook-length control protein FliK